MSKIIGVFSRYVVTSLNHTLGSEERQQVSRPVKLEWTKEKSARTAGKMHQIQT
jgi:hypothetical protein